MQKLLLLLLQRLQLLLLKCLRRSQVSWKLVQTQVNHQIICHTLVEIMLTDKEMRQRRLPHSFLSFFCQLSIEWIFYGKKTGFVGT